MGDAVLPASPHGPAGQGFAGLGWLMRLGLAAAVLAACWACIFVVTG
jgi:hypothetical protein